MKKMPKNHLIQELSADSLHSISDAIANLKAHSIK